MWVRFDHRMCEQIQPGSSGAIQQHPLNYGSQPGFGSVIFMMRMLRQWLMVCLLALLVPATALAQTLQEAARMAAQQYNAKVLSARTITKGQNRTHEIKLLTKDGVVKTVRIPDRRPRK